MHNGSSGRSNRGTPFALSWEHGEVVDLSADGAQLRCEPRAMADAYKGQTFDMTIRSNFEMLRVRAQVAWVRREGVATKRVVLGVKFVGLTPGQKSAIAAFASDGFVRPVEAEACNHIPAENAPPAVERRTIAGVLDLYALLGARAGDDEDRIREAYRAEASKWHPDHNKAPDAAQRFDELTKAYRTLRDPEARARYDALVHDALADALGPAPAAPRGKPSDRRDGPRLRASELRTDLGKVLDVSKSGLRIETSKRLKPGKSVSVAIADDQGALDLRARVMWVRPSGLGKRQIGLQIEHPNEDQRRLFWDLVRSDLNGIGSRAA